MKMSAVDKKEAIALIQVLQQKYPIAFPETPQPKVLLATTIEKEICDKELHEFSKKTINNALHLWCRGTRYESAFQIANAPLFHLDGSIVTQINLK